VIAQPAVNDVGGDVSEELEIGGSRPAARHPIGDFHEATRADAARDRLATRLGRAERREQASKIDDAGPIVGHDDRSRADVGADSPEGIELERGIQELWREDPAGRTADDDGLELASPVERACQAGDLPERRAERDLGDAVAVAPTDLDQDRAR
jgi:hypothetical protein